MLIELNVKNPNNFPQRYNISVVSAIQILHVLFFFHSFKQLFIHFH